MTLDMCPLSVQSLFVATETNPLTIIADSSFTSLVSDRSRGNHGDSLGTLAGRSVSFYKLSSRESVDHAMTPAWYARDEQTGRLLVEGADTRTAAARTLARSVAIGRGTAHGLTWAAA